MKAAAAFCAGFFAADFATTVLALKLPWYLPTAHRWEFAAHPSVLGMDYYGRVLFCLLCGAIAALIGSRLSPKAERVLFAWSAILLVFVAITQVHLLVHRQIVADVHP
jgi:MFS family permease